MPLKFFFFCFAFLQFKGSKVCNVENVIELGLILYSTLENAKLRPVSRNLRIARSGFTQSVFED